MTGPAVTGPASDPWTVAVHTTDSDWTPVGAGVLIDSRRVLTCAHVVRSSGADGVWVAFPKADDAYERVHATVAVRVDGAPESIADVVVLLLDGDAPVTAEPARLRDPSAADLTGRGWWAFGFPHRDPLGSAAHGRVGTALSYGWAHLDTESRHKVEQGFSGGGLWSEDYGAVVGLVGQAQAAGETSGDGRALTLRQIARWLPELGIDRLTRWTAEASGETALAAWGWQREPSPFPSPGRQLDLELEEAPHRQLDLDPDAARHWRLDLDPEAARHWRPRARGVGIDSEHGYRFRGRTAALTEIVGWLGRSAPDPRALVVTGSPGVGKSAVLGRIVTTADAAIRAVIPDADTSVTAPLGAVACAVHAKGKTALEVAVEIARAASVALPRTVEDLAPALRAGLTERPDRDAHFNVIIDALDEASTTADARTIVTGIVLPLVQTCSRVGVQVIVGSRRRDDDGDLIGAFGAAAHLIDLDAPAYFAAGDLEAYALVTLQGGDRPLSPYRRVEVARPVAARIADLADRNFLIAGLIARAHGLYDTEAVRPDELAFAPSVDAALRIYLERLPPVGAVPAAAVLTVLAFAEAPGLPLSLWRVGLEAQGVSAGEPELAAFVRSAAANFLVESGADSGGERSYRLFHQALGESLRAALGDAPAEEQAVARAWITYGRRIGWDTAPAYLLRSLATHAGATGLIDELLRDDDYLRHADLLRLIPQADRALSPAGVQRARMLRLTPHAVPATPLRRGAMFNVTAVLEGLRPPYRAPAAAPYRAVWGAVVARTERHTLTGHAKWVNAVCTVPTPDGGFLLASASSDTTIRLWDLTTGQTLRVLTGHTGPVKAICALPTSGDRHLLVSTSDDGTVRIWDPETGRVLLVLTGHAGRVNAVCTWTGPDGGPLLASGGSDRTVRLWEPSTGQELRVLTGHTQRVSSVISLPAEDGAVVLASAGQDRAVRVWDPLTGATLDEIPGQAGPINALAAFRSSHSRPLLAVAGDQTAIPVYGLGAGHQHTSLVGHSDQVHSLTTFTTGYGRTRLVSAGNDLTVRVWDPAVNEVLQTFTGHTNWISSVCTAVTADGRRLLASAGRDQTIRVWDLMDQPAPPSPSDDFGWARALRVVPQSDGTTLVASAGGDNLVRLWDPVTGRHVRALAGHGDWVNAVDTFTDVDGRQVLVSASGDHTLRIWGAGTGRVTMLTGHTGWVNAVCSLRTADGAVLLASGGDNDVIRLWDPTTGRQTGELPGHLSGVRALCAVTGADGRTLLASAGDTVVRLWDPATGERMRTLTGHGGVVYTLCTVPATDGRLLLASAGDDRTIRIWDLGTGETVLVITGHAQSVRALSTAVSADGTVLLLSGGDDLTLRVWDATGGRPIEVVDTHHRVSSIVEVAGTVLVGLPVGLFALRMAALTPGSS